MRLTRITAPATGVVTLADARDHLRVTDSVEDKIISDYIASASAYLDARDGVLGEALITQTWRLYLDAPAEVTIPIGPVQSIAAVQYIDTLGTTQTYGSANYRLSGAELVLVDGAAWPDTADREEAFWVNFVAGYGPATAVPPTVRHAALLMVGEMYEGRTMTASATVSDAFAMLLHASRSERGLF